jgi:hypothetical protein
MAEPPTHDMAGCSFTCPLTCTGPGDIDHESEADRRARLGAIGRTLDSEGVCTRCGCPDLHCCCPAVVPNIVPDGFWSKTPDDYEAYAIRQANARILAEAEVERLKAENDELQDDLLMMLKVRNEALRQAACEVIVGPDGQDDLDRSRLISKWVREGYEELGISEPDWAWIPTVEPKASLVEWGNLDRPGSATREGGGVSSAAVPTPAPGPGPSRARFEMLCLEDDEENVCNLPLGHDGLHEYECDHPSASGVDQAPFGPDKVWRCDVCGWRYRSIPVDGGPLAETVAADEGE